jgi:hypothetical protein
MSDPFLEQCINVKFCAKLGKNAKSISEIEHPPCSPDLTPTKFWLFPRTMSALKRPRYRDIEDVQRKWKTLEDIP